MLKIKNRHIFKAFFFFFWLSETRLGLYIKFAFFFFLKSFMQVHTEVHHAISAGF